MDTPAVSCVPELALPQVDDLQTNALWVGCLTGTALHTMPVDLYMTPLIL